MNDMKKKIQMAALDLNHVRKDFTENIALKLKPPRRRGNAQKKKVENGEFSEKRNKMQVAL